MKVKATNNRVTCGIAASIAIAAALATGGAGAEEVSRDIVIYGSSSAAISAAVQAKRMGASAVIVSPETRIGGLTTGGLGQTDIGNKSAFGGIALEFYRDVAKWYADPAHWKQQSNKAYKPDGQCSGTKGADSCRGSSRTIRAKRTVTATGACRRIASACVSPTTRRTASRLQGRRTTTSANTSFSSATSRRERPRFRGSTRRCRTARRTRTTGQAFRPTSSDATTSGPRRLTLAASMAAANGSAVQDVPYAELSERLLEDGQVMTLKKK